MKNSRPLTILKTLRCQLGHILKQTKSTHAEQCRVVLNQAEAQLQTLGANGQNALYIVQWLKSRGKPRTIHSRLQDALTVLRVIRGQRLRDALETLPSSRLASHFTNKGTDPGRYYSNMRSLYKFLTRSQKKRPPLPIALRTQRPRKVRAAEYVMTDLDITQLLEHAPNVPNELFPNIRRVSAGDMFKALLLIAKSMGGRIEELLNLQLGDIWVTDRLTVLIANGKNGKGRTSECTPASYWALSSAELKFLRQCLTLRYQEENEDQRALFFHGSSARQTPPQIGDQYDLILKQMQIVNPDLGTHDLRRYRGNTVRTANAPLIEIMNMFGQTTVETPPNSYLRIYPALQQQQLGVWLKTQHVVKALKRPITILAFAHAQGISREAARKLLLREKAEVSSHEGRQTIQETAAIRVLQARLKIKLGQIENELTEVTKNQITNC